MIITQMKTDKKTRARIARTSLATLLLVTVLFSHSCGCHKKDECEGKHPVSAGFTVKQVYRGAGYDYPFTDEGDTLLVAASYVRFEANEVDATYKWQIGQDAFTTKAVSGGLDEGSVLDATLVVDKPHDAKCFPTDDGKDTLSRRIVAVPLEQAKIFGTFEGYFEDDPNVKRKIRFEPNDSITGNRLGVMRVVGFPDEKDDYLIGMYASSNTGIAFLSYNSLKVDNSRAMWWSSNIGWHKINAKINVQNDIEFDYYCRIYPKTYQQYYDESKVYEFLSTNSFTEKQGKFKGKKISN